VPKQLRLPRGNFVVGVGRETTVTTTIVSTKASSIGTTTEAAVKAASISASRSIVTEAATEATTTKTIIGLIVGTIVPLNVVWVIGLELLKEVGNILLGLNQDLAEVLSNVLVAVVKERRSLALVANTRSTADAVDVLGDAVVLS
jgi:hypothetical protein